jgi:hypothetical protein
MRSENVLHVGAEIAIPMEDGTVRRCDVVDIDDGGFTVRFYTPDGKGPFLCALPHAELPANTIHRTLEGPDMTGGLKQSWWKDRRLTHGEGTGEF